LGSSILQSGVLAQRKEGTRAASVCHWPSRADREVYQRVLERFEDRLNINPINRSRLVAIQFDSRDAELAARVVNSLAENYVEQNLEARWGQRKGC